MAEYTKLSLDEIKKILTPYAIGPVTRISPMKGGQANSSFLVETKRTGFILSICDEKDFDEIKCLTRVLEYLAGQKFPTSRLVKTRDNRLFVEYNGKPAYVKQYMTGQMIEKLSPDMAGQVGTAMAALHKIPAPEYLPDRFPYGLETFDLIFDFHHPYIHWLKEKKAFLENEIDPASAKAFIHGDIFWDNLLFENNRLKAVLDFEEACRYFKLYDIGVAAVGCCTSKGRFDMEKVKSLIKGYQKVFPFSQTEKHQLKIFIEYAAAAGSFWRFRQYNIRYPDAKKAGFYKELSDCCDQIHEMPDTVFRNQALTSKDMTI